MALVPKPYTYVPNPPGGGTQTGCLDWINKIGYFFAGDIYSFNLLTRVQLSHILAGTAFTNINLTAICTGPDGLIYSGTITSAHLVIGFNGNGTTASVFNDIGGTHGAIGFICATTNGANIVCVTAGLNSGQGPLPGGAPICAFDMTNLVALGAPIEVNEGFTSVAPGNARVAPGPNGKAVATALGNAGGTGATTLGIYVIDVTTNPFTMTRAGGHIASDFGAGALTAFGAPCYDNTDGNIIACVQVGSNKFVCKFSSSTAAIIWQTAMDTVFDFDECVVKNGFLRFPKAFGAFERTLNTITGAIVDNAVSPSLTGFTSKAYSNDALGLDVINVNNNSGANPQWETFGPPPAPLVTQGGVIRVRA